MPKEKSLEATKFNSFHFRNKTLFRVLRVSGSISKPTQSYNWKRCYYSTLGTFDLSGLKLKTKWTDYAHSKNLSFHYSLLKPRSVPTLKNQRIKKLQQGNWLVDLHLWYHQRASYMLLANDTEWHIIFPDPQFGLYNFSPKWTYWSFHNPAR